MKHTIITPLVLPFMALVFLADQGQCVPVEKSGPFPYIIAIRASDNSELQFTLNEHPMSLTELKEYIARGIDKFGDIDPIILLPSKNISYAQVVGLACTEPFSRIPLFVVSIDSGGKLVYFCTMNKDDNVTERMRKGYLSLFHESSIVPSTSSRLWNQLKELYSPE